MKRLKTLLPFCVGLTLVMQSTSVLAGRPSTESDTSTTTSDTASTATSTSTTSTSTSSGTTTVADSALKSFTVNSDHGSYEIGISRVGRVTSQRY